MGLDDFVKQIGQPLRIVPAVISTAAQPALLPNYPFPYCGVKMMGSLSEVLGLRFLHNYVPVVNDVVQVLWTGTDGFVLGKLEDAASPGSVVQEKFFYEAPTADNTYNTASYTTIYSPLVFTKRFDGTVLRFQVGATAWVATPVNAGSLFYGVSYNLGATWTDMARLYFNTTGQHLFFGGPGKSDISGMVAGTYSLQFGLKWGSGGGTLHLDANDFLSYTVKEVWP